jgi:hypothetical protein
VAVAGNYSAAVEFVTARFRSSESARCRLPRLTAPRKGRGFSRTRDQQEPPYIGRMVKITVSAQAFAAVASTLPLGSVAVESERAKDGEVGLWLDHATLAKLNHLREPDESYRASSCDWRGIVEHPPVGRWRDTKGPVRNGRSCERGLIAPQDSGGRLSLW